MTRPWDGALGSDVRGHESARAIVMQQSRAWAWVDARRGGSLYRAELRNAIAILRATRSGEGCEQILDRLDPDTMAFYVELDRSRDQVVVGATHHWDNVECAMS